MFLETSLLRASPSVWQEKPEPAWLSACGLPCIHYHNHTFTHTHSQKKLKLIVFLVAAASFIIIIARG